MVQEKKYTPTSGWFPLILSLATLGGGPALIIYAATVMSATRGEQGVPLLVTGIVSVVVGFVSLFGYQAIAPNQARVYLLFGRYKGSAVTSGFFWVNPFYSKKKISLRVRNFETGSVVWRVVNTAEALFEVDDYEDFVAVQSEAALRNLASRHPYDSEDHEVSLRGNTDGVCDQLRHDIQERLDKAGVDVIEARISHLAYAPEIAAAMLQRQQAQAVVAARTKIVEGAVSMVQMALDQLAHQNIVVLDDERRAAMVSNLLVVLCSDRHTQPVVNTGSLYQ